MPLLERVLPKMTPVRASRRRALTGVIFGRTSSKRDTYEQTLRTECRCERNIFLHLRWYCHSPYVLYIRVTYTFLIIAFWILLEKNNYLLMRYACRLIFTHLCLNSPDIFYVCGTRSGILISSKVRTYVRIIYILSIPF